MKRKKIRRDQYLTQLIDKKENGLIKIISGVRRCGKSFLLFELFKEHLLGEGVQGDHLICLALDGTKERVYREPQACYEYVTSRMRDEGMYYLLLDEVQMMDDFESVLNGLLRLPNLDIYVTGSNSRFLITDVATEFRGRGDELRVHPLNFAEYYSTKECSWDEAWREYLIFGGMPFLPTMQHPRAKVQYLRSLFRETYMRDIVEHNKLRRSEELDELTNILASNIGGFLSPNKLANTFGSVKHVAISAPTIKQYLDLLEDAFLIQRAERFDVRGNRYIHSPSKYYFVDIGLRNARINFRQPEEPHIMENVIFNELQIRGYQVDVGMVAADQGKGTGTRERKMLEVDFVANMGDARLYIQSALTLPSREKREQEERSLLSIRDGFKKVIITRDAIAPLYDDSGIFILPLRDFLLDPHSLSE